MNNLNYESHGLLQCTLVFCNSWQNLISTPVSTKTLSLQILQSNVLKGRFPFVFCDSSCEYYFRLEVERKQGVGQIKKKKSLNQKQGEKEFKQIQSRSIINIFMVLIITSWTSKDCIWVKHNLTTWFLLLLLLWFCRMWVPHLQFSLYSIWTCHLVAFWEHSTRFIVSDAKTTVVQVPKFLAIYGHAYGRTPKKKSQ